MSVLIFDSNDDAVSSAGPPEFGIGIAGAGAGAGWVRHGPGAGKLFRLERLHEYADDCDVQSPRTSRTEEAKIWEG